MLIIISKSMFFCFCKLLEYIPVSMLPSLCMHVCGSVHVFGSSVDGWALGWKDWAGV